MDGRDSQTVTEVRPVDSTQTATNQETTTNQPVVASQPDGVTEARRPATPAELRSRYGGMYWGADFIGFAVAIFFTTVFLGIVGAIVGAVGYELGAKVPNLAHHVAAGNLQVTLGIGALIGSLIAVFLAYFIGGYAAGRMARFSGAANGVGVWIWTVVVAILLSLAGWGWGSTRFNVGNQLHLTVNGTNLTGEGVISIAVTLAVMLIGAVLGGMVGAGFHRHIDYTVVQEA